MRFFFLIIAYFATTLMGMSDAQFLKYLRRDGYFFEEDRVHIHAIPSCTNIVHESQELLATAHPAEMPIMHCKSTTARAYVTTWKGEIRQYYRFYFTEENLDPNASNKYWAHDIAEEPLCISIKKISAKKKCIFVCDKASLTIIENLELDHTEPYRHTKTYIPSITKTIQTRKQKISWNHTYPFPESMCFINSRLALLLSGGKLYISGLCMDEKLEFFEQKFPPSLVFKAIAIDESNRRFCYALTQNGEIIFFNLTNKQHCFERYYVRDREVQQLTELRAFWANQGEVHILGKTATKHIHHTLSLYAEYTKNYSRENFLVDRTPEFIGKIK